MAIAPIRVGDTSARAKMNDAITQANDVPSKASQGQLSAQAASLIAAIAQEAAARASAMVAEAAARQSAIMALPLSHIIQHRPGDAPAEFCRTLTDGEAADIGPLPSSILRYSESGRVVRLTGDDVVAPRHLYPLEPGRLYLATFAVRRAVNSSDPDNDAVRCALAWYGQGKGRLSSTPQAVVQDMAGLTTGSGRRVVSAVVSRMGGAQVDIVAPAGARYARPYVQTYGTLVQNDVEVIEWRDITNATLVSPDVDAVEARLSAIESLALGDRLSVVESEVTAPADFRLATVGGLAAASVPITAETVDVLGYSDPGDRGRARWRSAPSEPAHAGKRQDSNGRWFEIAERVINPAMLGNDLQTTFNVAAALGAEVELTPFATYLFGSLSIPANIVLRANRAVLRHDGTAASTPLTIGSGFRFDSLFLQTPGTETATDFLSIGACDGSEIRLVSDIQRAGGGITSAGQDFKVDRVTTRKIDRPLHLYNQSLIAQTTGSRIGYLDIEGYVRGFRADFCSFSLGGIFARGRSGNASMSPGHNGVLIQGCADWYIGDSIIADAAEHAFRIGGSPHAAAKTKNFIVGDIKAQRSGGCAFKINPTLLASPGVTETSDNGLIGNIIGIDCANGSFAGNRELLRLTHGRQITIASAFATIDQQTVSAQDALRINDCRNVWIGRLAGVAVNSAMINIDGTSDITPGEQFGGDVIGLYVAALGGVCSGNNAIAVNTTFSVGRMHINCDGVEGFATNLLRWVAGSKSGPISITGVVFGAVPPNIQDAPDDDDFTVDLIWNNRRSTGRAAGMRAGAAAQEFLAPAFSEASQAPNGLFLNSAQSPAGAGAYGAGLEFSRVGSSRRGAAIAPRQGSIDEKEVGLDFLIGDTNSTANEALLLALRLTHLRRMQMADGLATYASNAAAVAAGLPVGTFYWTPTGEGRVVV